MPRASGSGSDTVERILEASIALLEEAGYEGFNTNAIAARAGVNVATLYRYFPDKFAVVTRLATGLEAQRAERVIEQLEVFVVTDDWRGCLRQIAEAVTHTRVTQPGAAAVRRALQASPSLQSLDRAAVWRMVDAFACALRRRRPAIDTTRADTLAAATVMAVMGLFDLALERPELREMLTAEAAEVAIRYLAPELD